MPKDGVDLGPGAVVLGTRECGPWECLEEKRNRLRRVPRCGMKWNRPADRSLPWVGRDGLGAPTCRRRREVGEKWSLRLRRSRWSLVLGPWSLVLGPWSLVELAWREARFKRGSCADHESSECAPHDRPRTKDQGRGAAAD
jgi:hypothetical protein